MEELVREAFAAVDVDWIVQIPVREGDEDNLGWLFYPTGAIRLWAPIRWLEPQKRHRALLAKV
ncbi:UNVERIFIED_CONTAM: hypothetical protein Slati_4215200 [Sesamum latifolium]|uniref:Uncharacterized protein n=1 Tax=Sesamum latifolium TaxID=2727402 RepID=A0AAW2TCK4_9LAMI